MAEIIGEDEFVKAACFYAEQLLISCADFSAEIFSIELPEGFRGVCTAHVDDKEFYIILSNKLSREDALVTIAHEMVHVKQYLRAQLQDAGESTIWFSRLYDKSDFKDWYWDAPWEIEAHAREKELYNLWKSQ